MRTNTKKDKRNPLAPKGKDKKAYFNVLREVGSYIREHNSESVSNPHKQYRWYGPEVEDKNRTDTLMRIVDDTAPTILGWMYGQKTYHMIRGEKPEHLELLVLMIYLDDNFDPLTQGVRFFPTRKIVGAKLFSKRKIQRATEERERKRNASSTVPPATVRSAFNDLRNREPDIQAIMSHSSIEHAPSSAVVPHIPRDVTPSSSIVAAVTTSPFNALAMKSSLVRFAENPTEIPNESRNSVATLRDVSNPGGPSHIRSGSPHSAQTGSIRKVFSGSSLRGSSSIKQIQQANSGTKAPAATAEINLVQSFSLPKSKSIASLAKKSHSGKDHARVRVNPFVRGREKHGTKENRRGTRSERVVSYGVQPTEILEDRLELLDAQEGELRGEQNESHVQIEQKEDINALIPSCTNGEHAPGAGKGSVDDGKMYEQFVAWLKSQDKGPLREMKNISKRKRMARSKTSRKRRSVELNSSDELETSSGEE